MRTADADLQRARPGRPLLMRWLYWNIHHHFTCKLCRSKWYKLNLRIFWENYTARPEKN